MESLPIGMCTVRIRNQRVAIPSRLMPFQGRPFLICRFGNPVKTVLQTRGQRSRRLRLQSKNTGKRIIPRIFRHRCLGMSR